MQRSIRIQFSGIAVVLGLASAAAAPGSPLKITPEKPGFFKLAKVQPAEAQQTAQAKFPQGTIKSGELEREDGKLIYTFEIQLPEVKGIEEVNIDAMTGAIIATEHENPVAAPSRPKVKKPASS